MSEKRFPKAYPYINENVTVDMFECPDCGFEYNAHHEMGDEEGGYECVLCSEANLQAEVERLQARNSEMRDVLDDAYGEILRDKRGRVADIIEEWGDKHGNE